MNKIEIFKVGDPGIVVYTYAFNGNNKSLYYDDDAILVVTDTEEIVGIFPVSHYYAITSEFITNGQQSGS